MYKLIFPFLRWVDPESAHDKTLRLLEIAQNRASGRLVLRYLSGNPTKEPIHLMGLDFPNCLGVAAGFDKDVRVTKALALLGFGHIEVGTITPDPQEGNTKPRLFRLPSEKAIINRMGFPNCGSIVAAERLRKLSMIERNYVLGVSIGKQKETALENAVEDYNRVMERVYPYADYIAINVSSPNTPELRQLQRAEYLDQLIRQLTGRARILADNYVHPRKPILVKISPDLTYHDVDVILEVATRYGIDGIIATNTTVQREGLTSNEKLESGGLSGLPIAARSNDLIRYISQQVDEKLVIIGAGGVFSTSDVQEKLDSGASLVQLYTSLVYEGPGLAGRLMHASYS